MSTELQPYSETAPADRMEYARMLASAGDLLPKGLMSPWKDDDGVMQPPRPSPGKVFLVLETGAMLGLHPIAAIQGIFVIDGKTSMSAQLMAAVVRSHGYRLRTGTTGQWGAEFVAWATLTRPDDPEFEYRVEWTEARASRAGLLTKDNWIHYPEGLSKARAISEVIREGGQDALSGVVYTPEELGADVDSEGNPRLNDDGEVRTSATPIESVPTATPPARKRATNGTQGTKRTTAPAEAPKPADEATTPQEPLPGADGEELPAGVDENVIDAEVVEDDPAAPTEAEIVADLFDAVDRNDRAAVDEWNATYGRSSGRYITSTEEMADNDAKIQGEAAASQSADDAAKAEHDAMIAANVAAAKAEGQRKREERAAQEAEELKRAERARIAAEQEEAALAQVDTATGEVPETAEQMDARLKAERAERGAPTTLPKDEATAAVKAEPEPWAEGTGPIESYEVVTAADKLNWAGRLEAATTTAQVKEIWDDANATPGAMTSGLRMDIVKRKAKIESAPA